MNRGRCSYLYGVSSNRVTVRMHGAEPPSGIETVQRMGAVPTILEVVCRTTGMRFAAVARVTEERWVACSVLDNIDFGLKSGW